MKNFFFLFLLFPLISQAQKGNNELSFAVGRAIPTGNFGEQDLNAGLAENGINFEAYYGSYLSPNTAWVFSVRLSSNPVNEGPFNDALKAELPSGVEYSSNIGNWATTSFLTGIQSKIELSEDVLDFELRILGGYVIANSPSISASTSYQGSTVNTNQSRGTSKRFGFLAGAGMRVKANEKTSFRAGINYFHNNAEFDDVQIRQSGGNSNNVILTESFKQEIRIVGVEVGVAFLL